MTGFRQIRLLQNAILKKLALKMCASALNGQVAIKATRALQLRYIDIKHLKLEEITVYNLRYLNDIVKKEINEILNETRGRKAKAKPGRKLKDKDAMQTVLMLLLATLKGWYAKRPRRVLKSSSEELLQNIFLLSPECWV